MNLPNLLTLSRIPFLFIITGLLCWEFPFAVSIAFVVFVIAGLTDWLDGKIARDRGIVSVFGQLMDALTDKILTVGLFTSYLVLGYLKPWMLFLVLIILSREFLITGMRMVAAARNTVLPAEKAGKIKTVFQIIALGALIVARASEVDWDPMFELSLAGFTALAYWVGWILFTIATLLTGYSGVFYITKYWNLFMGEEDK